jgi:translation initiation factor 2B subunit (eIF-2B alpha/beta/delta family)
MKKHNCQKWHEEGQGCVICSKSGLLKKDEILQIQSWSNAHISELKREIEELEINLKQIIKLSKSRSNAREWIISEIRKIANQVLKAKINEN